MFRTCIGQSTIIFQYRALFGKVGIEKLTFLFKICDIPIIILNWRNARQFSRKVHGRFTEGHAGFHVRLLFHERFHWNFCSEVLSKVAACLPTWGL